MAKVIGLSGAQGGGKSSLLGELQERDWVIDQFRVSRAVQAQLGWASLDNVLKGPQTMMDFQNAVLKQKLMHDYRLACVTNMVEHLGHQVPVDKSTVVLTERTYADICAYTTHWTWELHHQGKWTLSEASEFLHDFVRQCNLAQEQCYSGVLLLPYMPDVITWEEDPNRAKRETVDQIYEGVERFTQAPRFLTQKKLTITKKSVLERADQVEEFLRAL